MANDQSTLSLKQDPRPQPRASTEELTGGATVTVASKIPFGFIMRVYRPMEGYEPVMGGGQRATTTWVQDGPEVVLNPCSQFQNRDRPWEVTQSGFSLTPGVPKVFWEKWLDQHKTFPAVVAGLIFAHQETASVKARALDDGEKRSGLERLNPDKLPRGLQRVQRTEDSFRL